jgi:hypothetical protein
MVRADVEGVVRSVTKNKLSRIPRIRSFQKMESEVNIGVEGDSKEKGYINEQGDTEQLQSREERESVDRNRCLVATFGVAPKCVWLSSGCKSVPRPRFGFAPLLLTNQDRGVASL